MVQKYVKVGNHILCPTDIAYAFQNRGESEVYVVLKPGVAVREAPLIISNVTLEEVLALLP